jgi:mRNA-degrading endonuclease RelE of RelBE toxin-antitoxin system
MYDLNIKPEADEIFKKLAKKNRKQLEIIHKKIQETAESTIYL